MNPKEQIIAFNARLKTNYSILEGLKKSIYSVHNSSHVNPKAGDQIKATCEHMAKLLVECLPMNDIEEGSAETILLHNHRDWEQYVNYVSERDVGLVHLLLAIRHGGATKSAMSPCLGFKFNYDGGEIFVGFDGGLFDKVRSKYNNNDKPDNRSGFRGRGRGSYRGRGGHGKGPQSSDRFAPSSGHGRDSNDNHVKRNNDGNDDMSLLKQHASRNSSEVQGSSKIHEVKSSEAKTTFSASSFFNNNTTEKTMNDAEKALIDDGKKLVADLQKLSTAARAVSPTGRWADAEPDQEDEAPNATASASSPVETTNT